MAKYFDIRMKNDDLAVDGNRQAEILTDVDVITQDIIHMIRESGYLVEMIAERKPERRKLLLMKIRLLVEEDERIVPGTVKLTEAGDNFIGGRGTWTLSADTYEFGKANLQLEATT